MLRRAFLVLFACGLVWGQALLAQEQEVPDEVNTALETLSDEMANRDFSIGGRMDFASNYSQIVEERDLSLSDLVSYDYAPGHTQEENICVTAREEEPLPGLYPVPIYVVNLRVKHTDGGEITYTYHVELGGEATNCNEDYATATPTATVDLTRTTLTPTFTPSNTPTQTNTFTPTYTPSATMTITPSFTPTPSNTPTITTTPRPDAVTCPGFLTSRLVAGEQAQVLPPDPIRLRDQPSTAGSQLATIPAEAIFDVLEGPECDPAGRAWWRVSYRNTVGWTVEGQDDEYFTEPLIGSEAGVTITVTPSRAPRVTATAATETAVTCPGFMPSRLIVGGQGFVTPGEPNNVRNAPSASGTLVGQIDGGAWNITGS